MAIAVETVDVCRHHIVQIPQSIQIHIKDCDVGTESGRDFCSVGPNDAATQENTEFYQEMIDQGVTGIIAGRPTQVP